MYVQSCHVHFWTSMLSSNQHGFTQISLLNTNHGTNYRRHLITWGFSSWAFTHWPTLASRSFLHCIIISEMSPVCLELVHCEWGPSRRHHNWLLLEEQELGGKHMDSKRSHFSDFLWKLQAQEHAIDISSANAEIWQQFSLSLLAQNLVPLLKI